MPRPATNDYFFYKIVNVNSDVDLCYVGSTANWKQRENCHKSNCHNENGKKYNCKLYRTIRDYGGWDEFKMVEIGRAEHLTLTQSRQKEEEYRVMLNAELNTKKCYISNEQRKEQTKKYITNNVDKIKERMKVYYTNNADKIKDKSKQYQIDNAAKIKEYRKEWDIKNADKLKEKFNCECGGCYTRNNKSHHLKSQKHIIFINKK